MSLKDRPVCPSTNDTSLEILNLETIEPVRTDSRTGLIPTPVAIREEQNNANYEIGNQFRFGPVWHMDLVGTKSTAVPNVVGAFHFLQVPASKIGGETVFCNMDIAYASLPFLGMRLRQ